jgi:8-oxo-dGTP diphosphatase
MEKIPRIGVAVIIKRENKILLGERKGSHGEGTWSFPGGHLEFGEKVAECAKREVLEETGLEIKNVSEIKTTTEDFFEVEQKHYITLYVCADYISGEAKIMEPNKCTEWGWFGWNNLPEPLFLIIKNLKTQNFNPFN